MSHVWFLHIETAYLKLSLWPLYRPLPHAITDGVTWESEEWARKDNAFPKSPWWPLRIWPIGAEYHREPNDEWRSHTAGWCFAHATLTTFFNDSSVWIQRISKQLWFYTSFLTPKQTMFNSQRITGWLLELGHLKKSHLRERIICCQGPTLKECV